MRIRPTVGLLVLDDTQRILLFKVQDAVAIDIARPGLAIWWGPPGGYPLPISLLSSCSSDVAFRPL
jgi:hypothetical protein